MYAVLPLAAHACVARRCPAWAGVPKTHWGKIFSKRAFLFTCAKAIITRSWFETALNYKLWILDPKIEEFPFLVHKLSVTLIALRYKPE